MTRIENMYGNLSLLLVRIYDVMNINTLTKIWTLHKFIFSDIQICCYFRAAYTLFLRPNTIGKNIDFIRQMIRLTFKL